LIADERHAPIVVKVPILSFDTVTLAGFQEEPACEKRRGDEREAHGRCRLDRRRTKSC
jgi:hypothetical protein